MALLSDVNCRGTTVIMATHNQAIVDRMRRRVVEIEAGRIVRDERRGLTAMRLRTIATLTSQAVRTSRGPRMTTTVVVMACMLALSLFTLVAVNLTVIGASFRPVELRVFLLPDAGPDAVASWSGP